MADLVGNQVVRLTGAKLTRLARGSNRIVRIDSVGGVSPVAFADGPNSVAVGADHVIYGTERTHPWVLRVDASGTTRLPRSKD